MMVAISWSAICHSLGPVSKIASEAEFTLMNISLSSVKKNYQLFNISFAIDKL